MLDRAARLQPPHALSVISRVELENGVYREPAWAGARRRALDLILTRVVTLDFGEPELAAYREIVTKLGYSRQNVLDRMIAATALRHGATLVTMNGRDFRRIEGLRLEVWEG